MKIKELTRRMNNHGTEARIRVLKHTDDANILVYVGYPRNIDEAIGNMRVNSFTVIGRGFIEIHTT